MEPDRCVGRVHLVQPANTAALLIVSSVVAVDPGGLWPFGPLRWLIVSTVGVVVWAACMRRPCCRLDPRTFRLWMVLLVCLFAGALTNSDVWVAIVGTDTRHFGLVTWVLCLGLFCAGQQLRGHEVVLLRAGTTAALAVGLWCAWEAVVGQPIALAITTSRLTGPFGSAALLGAALCLLLPLAIALSVDSGTSRWWRVTGVIAALLGVAALIGSGARAAWAGLAFAAAVVAWRDRRIRRQLVMAVGGLALLVVLALPVIGSVLERSHGTSSRLDEWRVAMRVVANHPLLGVGPEGYRIAVSEGVDAEYERAYPRDNVLPDRAHSSLLDVALAGGIVAAAAYAGLLVVIGRRAVRRLGVDPPGRVALTASMLAYFSAQLLLFPIFELDPIAWMLAGVVVVGKVPARVHSERRVHLTTVAATVIAVATATAGVLDVAANRLAREALTASAEGDDAAARDHATRATRLRPDSIAYRMIAAQVLLTADTLTATDLALSHAGTAVDVSSHDPIAVDLRASSLLQRASQSGDERDGRVALLAWLTLVDRDPNRARWQLQLGKAAALVGEVEIARDAWERAAALGSPQAERLLEELQ